MPAVLLRSTLLVAAAAGAALVLAEWLTPAAHDPVVVLQPPAAAQRGAPPPPAASVAGPDAFATAAPASGPVRAAPLPGPTVVLAAKAPQALGVGEMDELVVSIDTRRPVGRIAFTLAFDPNVLQVRSGAEGGWMMQPGVSARYEHEIDAAEARIQVRIDVDEDRAPLGAGAIAVVGFQAMAPGSTTVTMADVEIDDPAQRPLPSMVAAPRLNVSVLNAR